MTQAEDRATAGADAALLDLLSALKAQGYGFVTPTPATHARVLAKLDRSEARSLTDVFGWSLPFAPEVVGREIVELLARGDALGTDADGRLRSRLRASSLGDALYLHSAFPTDAPDAVFFGPDSYRFANLIVAELTARPPRRGATLVDIGTGAGVGAIVAAGACPALAIHMTDINRAALRLADVNARAAGVRAEGHLADDLAPIAGQCDVVLANPPYIIDDLGRAYRDGGGMHGAEVAFEMARGGVERLAPGGRVILYTGSAIVDGADGLGRALGELAAGHGCAMRYFEIDPDVFGEELEKPAYRDVDRIALVAAIITRPN